MESSDLQKKLIALSDPVYRDFQRRLIPTIDKKRILGVRTPVLRKFAKEFGQSKEVELFLSSLPHFFYDENNLHAFLIEGIKDFEQALKALEVFLPYVDNWATCDMLRPKILKKHKEELYPHLKRWLSSPYPYVKRFAIGELMNDYLKDSFSTEHPPLVLAADDGSYYLSMMTAWYFATALVFRYEEILPFIEKRRLRPETHKRTIQKALESFRISKEHKKQLKCLR